MGCERRTSRCSGYPSSHTIGLEHWGWPRRVFDETAWTTSKIEEMFSRRVVMTVLEFQGWEKGSFGAVCHMHARKGEWDLEFIRNFYGRNYELNWKEGWDNWTWLVGFFSSVSRCWTKSNKQKHVRRWERRFARKQVACPSVAWCDDGLPCRWLSTFLSCTVKVWMRMCKSHYSFHRAHTDCWFICERMRKASPDSPDCEACGTKTKTKLRSSHPSNSVKMWSHCIGCWHESDIGLSTHLNETHVYSTVSDWQPWSNTGCIVNLGGQGHKSRIKFGLASSRRHSSSDRKSHSNMRSQWWEIPVCPEQKN